MKTDNNKKTMMARLAPLLIIVIGLLLMAMKIVEDSEPGAIPLLLVLIGTVWFFLQRFKFRSQKSNN